MQRRTALSTPGSLILVILTVACLVGSYDFMARGLNELAEARQVQRLPITPLSALAKGPYLVEGQVTDDLGTHTGPYSDTPSVYVFYKEQHEYRDSDGDLKLETVDSGHIGSRFQLQDDTGTVVVNLGANPGEIEWSLRRTWHHRSGSYIYSEWTLKPGDNATVIGQFDQKQNELTFPALDAFNLPAVVSRFGPDTDIGEQLYDAGAKISLATGLLALGIALGLIILRIHRLWVYVLAMTIAVSGTLTVIGVYRLTTEWSAIANLYEGRYQQLAKTEPSMAALVDVAALNHRIRQSTSGWLDHWMFRRLLENRLPLPDLNVSAREQVQKILANHPPVKRQYSGIGLLLALGSLVLAVLLIRRVISSIKLKRLIEALPTSSTQGLSFGLAELKGRVELDNNYPPLREPLSGQDCVAYRLEIEEKRGSGNDAKWTTVETRTEHVPFRLRDDQHHVLVYPEGAQFGYSDVDIKQLGKQRHTVKFLVPEASIYCLGFAGLDQHQPDHLSIQHEKDLPFLISNSDEDGIVMRRGAWGFVGIAASLGLLLFTATTMLAADGRFSPDNLLISALVVPLALCVYTGILHYNDLVFLKNRVNRARANIDTILQQRHDLWPRLEDTVKASMAHERDLLTAIATLRSEPPATMDSTNNVGRTINQEQAATQSLKGRLEDYPELKNHQVVRRFMEIMASTENYLSLLRNSYSDSAMIYNTRLQTLPDLLLAWLFRFGPAQQFTHSHQEADQTLPR